MSAFKLRKEKDCLNCGRIVEENFCPHCGQENIVVKEDALHMVSHAIADYFHFEHKFFGTLKPLMFKPGQLTAAYVAGKRVSFIHPIRLYIFVSIVFFLVIVSLSDVGNNSKVNVKPRPAKQYTQKQKDSILAVRMKELEIGMRYVPMPTKKRDSVIEVMRKNIALGGKGKSGWNIGNTTKWGGSWGTADTTVVDYEKNQAALPKEQRDGFMRHYYAKRSIELNKYPDPKKKFFEEFLHNIPKMMFLLLPLFALILKLVYINKNRYYYEHLIYSFHLHSAIFLSILFTILLQWLFGFIYDIQGWLTFLCLIYIVWYIYRSLRTFYNSTRWVTVLKLFFLTFCYNIVLTLCFILVIALSFALM